MVGSSRRVISVQAVVIGLLLGAAACGGSGGPGGSGPFLPVAPYVQGDTDRLEAAIVMPVGEWIFKSSEMGSGHPVFSTGLPPGTVAEHAALMRLLRRAGVRTLTVTELMTSALEHARRQGVLADWIRTVFPATAEAILPRLDELTGEDLLGLSDGSFYHAGPDSVFDPLFPGMSSIYWSRDFAAMTPKGVIIGDSRNGNRVLEKHYTRLMFEHADGLREIPVLFDAGREDLSLDGGDVIVLGPQELLLGTGNRTSVEAASLLARRLGMDVYGVAMPPADRPNGLGRQLLHLDSICNLLDTSTALAVPFFLEREWSECNPMGPLLAGLARQMERLLTLDGELRAGDPESLRRTIAVMPEVGWVTRYRSGSGEAEPLGLKLVDLLRERGYRIVFVGGERGELPLEEYALERAMYELRWQGANVVQLAPGRVIALEQNGHTNRALRAAGIEVLTFPGQALSMRNGGPHCLLMPLQRRR